MPGISTRTTLDPEQVALDYQAVGRRGHVRVVREQGRRGHKFSTRTQADTRVFGFGPVGNHRDITCLNQDLDTTLHAIMERGFYVKGPAGFALPPQPASPRIFIERCGRFRHLVLSKCPRVTKLSRQQFVDYYTGRKRTIYENAAKSLEAKPLGKSDGNVKTFVKKEKTDRTAKPDPVPRMIQPHPPRFNIELGCYLRPVEGVIYTAIEEVFGYSFIAKGRNADDIGTIMHDVWRSFVKPVAIGIDMKRFDQHTGQIPLKFEHSFYNSMYRCKILLQMLRIQLSTVGIALTPDGIIKYLIDGIRTSGCFNTAMGNVIIMCAMIYAYIEHLRVTHSITVKVVDAGDDAVLFTEKDNLHFLDGMEQYFLDFGYQVEIEDPVYTLEQVEFCQTSPICVNGKYRMVRNVKTALSKDSMYVTPLDEGDWNARRLAIAQCGIALAGDVPIFSSFYRMLARGAGTSRKKYRIEICGLYRFSAGMTAKLDPVADSTRLSFYLSTGITPDRQIAIEREYDAMVLQYHDPVPLSQAPFPLFNIAL